MIFRDASKKLQQGDLHSAKKGFLIVVKYQSKSHIVWHNLGMVHQHLNEFEHAIRAYLKAIKIKGDFVDSWVNLGIAYEKSGLLNKALKSAETALEIERHHPRGLNLFGSIQARMQNYEVAEKTFAHLLHLFPGNWDAAFNLANVSLELKEYTECRRLIEILQTTDPNNKRLIELSTQCYINQKDYNSAALNIRHLESTHPKDETVLLLGLSLREVAKDHFGVIEWSNILLKINSRFANVWNSQGGAYFQLDAVEKARTCYEKAIELDSDNYEYYNNLGLVYSSVGDKKKAEMLYRRSLSINPEYGEAYKNLAGLKKFASMHDSDAQVIESLWKRGGLPRLSTIKLSFALGKVYDDCAMHSEAFKAYRVGNDLKFEDSKIDLDKYFAHLDRISSVFKSPNSDAVQSIPGLQPIFVLGMPRSGTTLVEQIISRHSSVTGCGELPGIEKIINRVESTTTPVCIYPNDFGDVPASEYAAQREIYIDEIRKVHDIKTPYITDKMPFNFAHVWLIKTAFPFSPIVNCQRHPLDVILSNYFQLFGSDVSFVYNLAALSEYYVRYHHLMQHWSAMFGAQITSVRYENLVSDSESQIRSLIESIGLPWEESCLNQQASMEIVRTASIWQVREGIYTSSKERWRDYVEELQPAVAILYENGVLDKNLNHLAFDV